VPVGIHIQRFNVSVVDGLVGLIPRQLFVAPPAPFDKESFPRSAAEYIVANAVQQVAWRSLFISAFNASICACTRCTL